MEKIHKDALRKTRIRLVNDLHPDAEMWDLLVTEGIFTPIMMEYIQAEKTRADKVRKLLDDLVRRGPKAYKKFLRCLRDSGHEDLANTVEDNEHILRGLPVPFRQGQEDLNRNTQRPPEPPRPSSVTSQHFINIEPIPAQFSEESSATHYQPSAEWQTGPASLPCSLMTPSGARILPTAKIPGNSSSQPGSHIATTSQPGSYIATTSQPGSHIATTSQPGISIPNKSQTEGHIATTSQPEHIATTSQPEHIATTSQPEHIATTSQSGGHIATGNTAGQSGDDDVVMETADAPAPGNEVGTAYQRASAERPTYRMESKPRGYCLIINNKDYTLDSLMDPRVGTNVNREELQSLFTDLGFQVDAKDNLTGEAMKNTLKEFAAYQGLPAVDSLIVAFLCHGNSEKMYGVDGKPIYVQNDVLKVFSPRECPVMTGKPKLFLMNSCRGDMRDVGYPANSTVGGTVPFDAAQTDTKPLSARPPNDLQLTPNFQDLYLAYSTFHGHVSYRNREEGSWYIQKFVEVFREQAAFCDINAIMTQVNRRVASMYDPQSLEVQVPAPCNTLTKDWYFNPPTNF
ncbi:cell death protein 3-like isoform X2 [Pecten maximus]|uniref:cell death protein 3-like isoform X2 n=1 Tax=Pecten maximus TaxID=6579 RepID=UPI0014584646|nr:cell death protein 3-like isoform X2 [Pecten maximus]